MVDILKQTSKQENIVWIYLFKQCHFLARRYASGFGGKNKTGGINCQKYTQTTKDFSTGQLKGLYKPLRNSACSKNNC